MGLHLPLVYNTSGYDLMKTLRELDGLIDIYLPDLRYASDEWVIKFSEAPNYVAHDRAGIKEMYRQVGDVVLDEAGVAQRGLIVRHLILPNGLSGSRESLTWLAKEVSKRVTISAMSQYHPVHRAYQFPLLSRSISLSEYQEVLNIMEELGLEKGWAQGMDAQENYLPDFEREGHPFL